MRNGLTKIGQGLKNGRRIESWVTSFFDLAIAISSFFEYLMTPDLSWAVCTMGIGLSCFGRLRQWTIERRLNRSR